MRLFNANATSGRRSIERQHKHTVACYRGAVRERDQTLIGISVLSVLADQYGYGHHDQRKTAAAVNRNARRAYGQTRMGGIAGSFIQLDKQIAKSGWRWRLLIPRFISMLIALVYIFVRIERSTIFSTPHDASILYTGKSATYYIAFLVKMKAPWQNNGLPVVNEKPNTLPLILRELAALTVEPNEDTNHTLSSYCCSNTFSCWWNYKGTRQPRG